MDKDETPVGLAPSADSPREKRRKLQIGRGAIMVICGVGIAAFVLYTFTVLYGIFTAAN
ncbi:hypothetical protein [Shinella oryzae]|jgi:hypothetical protein|uniref:hypothetical protein n=1 Tax=Shinella oryzae TaxID=2871820 RepID=UPI001FF4E15B|nr:hypothetical protein [Shinella oryzae]UPA25866.1 hypothetical protein K6301_06670 [Shinella oryzae]